MTDGPTHCQDCSQLLTDKNQRNKNTLSILCDSCDARDRDDLAWLTGTGRFSQ